MTTSASAPVCATQLYVFHQVCSRKGVDIEDALDDVLGDVAAAGITHVEMWLRVVDDDQAMARAQRALQDHSLQLSALYGAAQNGVLHVRETAEQTVTETLEAAQKARELGCPMITVNPAPKPGHERKTDEELQTQAQFIDLLGQGLKELGMQLALHNHTPAALDNAREIRYNCDHTNPDAAGLCLDTHWVFRAGSDPFELLDAYPSRVVALHLRNSQDGIWSESLEDGDLDHARIAAWVERTGFSGPLTIELAYEQKTEITRPLREDLTRSREYIRTVFGV